MKLMKMIHGRDNEKEENVLLFQGEFPGYEQEPVRGIVLTKEEKYFSLPLVGVDLSPLLTKKRGKRISIDLEVYFETRVPGKFQDHVIVGKGEAFYFPNDLALYIQDLYIRQPVGKIGRAIPIHKHYNTKVLWN